jgi:hypothetical protein
VLTPAACLLLQTLAYASPEVLMDEKCVLMQLPLTNVNRIPASFVCFQDSMSVVTQSNDMVPLAGAS